MAKRKGSELATSPTAAAVVSSPTSYVDITLGFSSLGLGGSSGSDHVNAAFVRRTPDDTVAAAFTPATPRTAARLQWNETKKLILDLAAEYGASGDDAAAEKCLEANRELEDVQREIAAESSPVKSELRDRIDEERAVLAERNSELASVDALVSDLRSEAEALRRRNDSLEKERAEVLRRMERYRSEAAEIVEEVDEVELRQRREVRKIKYQISLYANISGIKWDYDEGEILKGEVNVPSKNQTRRFCIDPLDYDEFDVANALWDLMDGKEPTLTAAC
uniref:Kinetochore protein Spc24 n=1 Tax=Odontella aurita TaxID=265563 RepID=A0A7S4N5F9_9STRA